jgi:hypothetical protein
LHFELLHELDVRGVSGKPMSKSCRLTVTRKTLKMCLLKG